MAVRFNFKGIGFQLLYAGYAILTKLIPEKDIHIHLEGIEDIDLLEKEATAISDFIETRLKIGETPLVIIDGLNQSFAGWEQLVQQFLDKPVKVLITTREEDWFRYGADVSRASLKTVNIKLTIAEA